MASIQADTMVSEWAELGLYDIPQHHTDKRSFETLAQSVSSMFVILTTFSGIVLARAVTHRFCYQFNATICYLIEFSLTAVPGIIFVTVASGYSVHFVVIMIILSVCYILRMRSLSCAKSRTLFDLGKRPYALTIVRALTHMITAVCILAIDFESFYRPYRKSRHFGAQLMDTGIGLFVLTMGLVSCRPRNAKDLRRTIFRSALPLILLGIARLVAIVTIGYGQDAHEYGQHLNAFFTLGLTKLFGSLLAFLARTDAQLMPLALCVLVCHQISLTFGGISEYVMDSDLPRSTILTANREGLFSLPGFVAIYLLSIYFTKWLMSKKLLSYAEIIGKLRRLFILAVLCWALLAGSAYVVGVSRVTCNLGYVSWMFAIISTMLWLSIFFLDFIINNDDSKSSDAERLEQGSSSTTEPLPSRAKTGLFLICESLNMNGLIFFLLANILTGGVNIFLKPENRSDPASVLILIVYMLVITFVVYQLYKRRIRIA